MEAQTPRGPFPVRDGTVPYWRTQVHPIDEYRSSKDLPAECDVAIIGAGLSGVAAAYHLSRIAGVARPHVVVIEARQACSGATGRNGGHAKIKFTTHRNLTRKFGLEAADKLVTMVHNIIYALKSVVEKEKLDCEFELRRTLDVFLDENEAAVLERHWYQSLEAGEAWTRQIDCIPRDRAEQVTSITGAKIAFSGPACSFWPYKFVTQLLAGLVERGDIDLHTNTPVLSISRYSDSTTSLRTPRGSMKAKKVIFATNAYTSGLLEQFSRTLIPTKITATHVSPSHALSIPHLAHTYNISYDLSGAPLGTNERVDYLNPRPDGTIVVGGGHWTYKTDSNRNTWWDNWDDSSLHPSASTREHFDALMPTYFRGWKDSGAKVDSIWTGITGSTPDGAPFVGRVVGMGDGGMGGEEYVLAGYNGGGIAMIWSCAEAVARMVVNGVAFRDTGLPAFMDAERETEVF